MTKLQMAAMIAAQTVPTAILLAVLARRIRADIRRDR